MSIMNSDMTATQNDYALFLPALSGFYATFIGKQRVNNDYVDPARFPQGMTDMEQLNWLNPNQGIFKYRWSLYSAGHANLDIRDPAIKEAMVRDRDPSAFIVGDSGGFQIAKGQWPGDWRANSGCPKANKKRTMVLEWLDTIADYGMCLDIPSWVIYHPRESALCGISTYQEAVEATKFNNEYFIKNRRGKNNGGGKFLNVLQGANHMEADDWYETMKQYCDPSLYPDRHFDGWAFGGQTKTDVHLMLRRIVALKFDNLLQPGKHDWMHVLGTSKLEFAVLLTTIQRAVRRHINPNFTISYDCASPFLATANGQVYCDTLVEDGKKWSYRMLKSVDDKKYHNDPRSFKDVLTTDYGFRFKNFLDSPISKMLKISDICYYDTGVRKTDQELNGESFDYKNLDHYKVLPKLNGRNKISSTSWDSFSYALQMAHNVCSHIYSVQEANRQYDAGKQPAMLSWSTGDYAKFKDIVDRVFAAPTRSEAEDIIDSYSNYWMEILGNHGFIGRRALNANTLFNNLFTSVEPDDVQQVENDDIERESSFDLDIEEDND